MKEKLQKFIDKHGRMLAIILTASIGVILIISAIVMLAKYKDEITERSSSEAKYNTLIARNIVEDELNNYTKVAIETAVTIKECNTLTDIKGYLSESVTNKTDEYGIKFARYFDKSGKLFNYDGSEYLSDRDTALSYINGNNGGKADIAGYVGTFADETIGEGSMEIMGFYAPIKDSDLVNGVVIYYTRQTLVHLIADKINNEKAEFTAVCTDDGKVITGLRADTEGLQVFDYLKNVKFVQKTTIDKIKNYISENIDGTISTRIGNDDCLISVGANKDKLADLSIIELYRIDVLYASSLDFVQAIIGVVIVFAIIVVGVICYLVINSYHMRRTILNMETRDTLLDCLNRHGFEKEAKKILDVNLNSYFAVVVIELRHYKHLMESCGESEIHSLLTYLRLTLSKTVQIEEIYAHSEAGQFIMLLHAKDRQGLLERLKVHSFLAKQYKGANDFDVLLRYGIYEYNKDEIITVSKMIDFANEANNTVSRATVENAGMQFNFYSDELRQIRIINDSMELRMEGALQNGEFQIFYQPKYNLNTKRQDGCEALVRWYDASTDQYNRPALFMKLFESNGFIIKLDKYVYTKVCEYINYSIANGRTVFPVSVNISRVTAIQTDFVEYYTKTKKKYNIPDGQIMIEFTESFAYENYESLRGIIDKLHANGFKCSIDDFGCGYSSYRILKSLPMDEIKLDKFFLERGDSEERDKHIFESVITLAKKLGMKVTQEGVETSEELEKIISLGCDVVQGYYYSHPLGLNDYINFVA
ncbi:MAG: EAL domain-containing protein, partial [Firmicutes bacterium]|nr:EAL domain-containing protein [Candidatus Caballimonas caccae]